MEIVNDVDTTSVTRIGCEKFGRSRDRRETSTCYQKRGDQKKKKHYVKHEIRVSEKTRYVIGDIMFTNTIVFERFVDEIHNARLTFGGAVFMAKILR